MPDRIIYLANYLAGIIIFFCELFYLKIAVHCQLVVAHPV